MTDFRALCAELVEKVEFTWGSGTPKDVEELLNRARAALADEPAVPEGREPASVITEPSDQEVLKLAQQYSVAYLLDDGSACHPFQAGYDMRDDVLRFARAVLARWGTPNLAEARSSLGDAPQPVPVSERLPGDQLCWWYEPDEDDDGTGYGGNWTLLRIRGCVSYYTHWLPAHALPLPTANE